MPEKAILLQKSIGCIKGQEGHRGGQKGARKGKKGAREGKKGTVPFYFGLAGTLLELLIYQVLLAGTQRKDRQSPKCIARTSEHRD